MKIDINNSYTHPSYNSITDQNSLMAHNGATTGKESSNPERTDSVTISATAKHIDSSSRSNDVAPSFDTSRVAVLKSAIHDGSYRINPEQIAEKLHQFTMILQ